MITSPARASERISSVAPLHSSSSRRSSGSASTESTTTTIRPPTNSFAGRSCDIPIATSNTSGGNEPIRYRETNSGFAKETRNTAIVGIANHSSTTTIGQPAVAGPPPPLLRHAGSRPRTARPKYGSNSQRLPACLVKCLTRSITCVGCIHDACSRSVVSRNRPSGINSTPIPTIAATTIQVGTARRRPTTNERACATTISTANMWA